MATVPFANRINQRAKVKDLSREIMQNYLQQVGSDPAKPARTLPLLKLGRQVGVIGGAEEARFPLNVGLMMFNPQPHRFFPVMQIDVVWFPKEGPGGATNCVPGAPQSKLRISVTGGRPSANAAPRQSRTKRTMALKAVIRGGRIRMRQANAATPVELITLLKGPYATN